ncbi:hypothetical protein EPI10_025981 [Gossypium australe]|uniref:Secreted protein n=1 Tax=Gossypium australe TaxID=47621 RepID=A0A5B6W2K9_9ROSI|nr:hypothetical protein EPI10_025981 [Gossypium australe]
MPIRISFTATTLVLAVNSVASLRRGSWEGTASLCSPSIPLFGLETSKVYPCENLRVEKHR